jgi:hypothetical protein
MEKESVVKFRPRPGPPRKTRRRVAANVTLKTTGHLFCSVGELLDTERVKIHGV